MTTNARPFRHQAYRSDRPISTYRLLPQPLPVEPGSDEYFERIAAAGRKFAEQRVAAVYLVPGTFAGGDMLGMLTELARFAPGASESLQRWRKSVFDFLVGETGNFTQRFASDLQRGLNGSATACVEVKRFNWSSLNNHIARADGAVRLLAELFQYAESSPASLDDSQPPRIQLWGHSHGGNVIALAINLLAADAAWRDAFFNCTRRFYQSWFSDKVVFPVWRQVQEKLAEREHPLRRWKLDCVGYGVPIRYGWPASPPENLLLFVNHRPHVRDEQSRQEYLAPRRVWPQRMLRADDGDYVNRVGIAGSNFPPVPLALPTFLAERALSKLLEYDLPRQFVLTRVHQGMRVAEEGTTLLVDYHDRGYRPWYHVFGHAVYTRRKWLPFHCEQIAEEFY